MEWVTIATKYFKIHELSLEPDVFSVKIHGPQRPNDICMSKMCDFAPVKQEFFMQ